MKKLSLLFSLLALGYFVSIGCFSGGTPSPEIKNKILAAYETNSSVVLMGEHYFMDDTGEDVEILKHLVDQVGVQFIIREGENIGSLKNGNKFDFVLDVSINPHIASNDLLTWAKTVSRKYKISDTAYKNENVFNEESSGTYSGYVDFNGKIYISDKTMLDTAPKLTTPFILQFTDFGVGELQNIDKLPQSYIETIGVLIRQAPQY